MLFQKGSGQTGDCKQTPCSRAAHFSVQALALMKDRYPSICGLGAVALAALVLAALPALASRGGSTTDDTTAASLRLAAQHYRQIGDPQAALVCDAKADQRESVLIGYRDRPASLPELQRLYTGAKAEPVYGCYIGVNCWDDEQVDKCFTQFCRVAEKRHALLFDYASAKYTDGHMWEVSQRGGPWLQSAFEPGNLRDCMSGETLRNYARALAQVKRPVFLRWGSEMNGDWVSWHGDPALYIAKWREVHDTMAELAPNVAMVWCPSSTPPLEIDKYYPGDQYVDWVGVNFYVVSIHNNDPHACAERENPADLLRHVYATYASRKPMMICETGVTHQAQALGRPDYDFATARLGQLYGCLPRLYPRIKAICYYDVDNLAGCATGRPYNNYLLTDNAQVMTAYRKAIAPSYFLGEPQDPERPLPDYVEPLADGQTLSGNVHLSAWAKAWVIAPVVEYRLDDVVIGKSAACGTYDCQLDCSALKPGPHRLGLTMRDGFDGKLLKQVEYRIKTVASGPLICAVPVATAAAVIAPVAVATARVAPASVATAPMALRVATSKAATKAAVAKRLTGGIKERRALQLAAVGCNLIVTRNLQRISSK